MSNENKETAPESAAPDRSVSEKQLEDVAGGKRRRQNPGSGQVSPGDPAADLNGDGNVTLHEVVTFNRDQRDKN